MVDVGPDLGVAKLGGEPLVGTRARERVEVAKQHDRLPASPVRQPFGAQERLDLGQALGTAQAQMRVDDLHFSTSDLDRGPQGATGLEGRPVHQARKRACLDQLRGPSRQDSVAVFLFHDSQSRVEVNVPHPELARDRVRLVDAAAASASHIELLERNDIGSARGNHLGDPGRRLAPVRPKAATHVVGQDPRHDPE
jgi:hypothetical protein